MKDRAQIYDRVMELENKDDPRVITYNMVEKNSKVLDVGCACGSFGDFLCKTKNCEVHGMEYNEGSVKIAKELGTLSDVHRIDLNTFNEKDFKNM